MARDEEVLVVKRTVVEQEGMFHGLNFEVDRYLRRLFAPGVLQFMPRSQAEKSPEYKQLIPYVIMNHDNKYLTYVRGKRAGETRLVGNRSIGIGGHINPIDDEAPLFDADFRPMYSAAVEREVDEEVLIEANHTDRIVALLNDDSNEVGQVHLGVVHYWTLDSSQVERKEQMITQMTFMDIDELKEVRDSMETWSQLCLDGLGEMAKYQKSAIPLESLFENA